MSKKAATVPRPRKKAEYEILFATLLTAGQVI